MNEPKVFVDQIKLKDSLTSTFLVKHIALVQARDGSKYLNLVLGDKTGTMECRVWNDAEKHSQQIVRGDYVKAKGKMNLYQNHWQFVVSDLEKKELAEINEDDYMEKSAKDPEVMFSELKKIVLGLDDIYIKELLKNILEEPEIARRLKTWPAGKSIHHAYRSGLLEHVLSCSKLALTLSEVYGVNRNYVVAGCILHDLCKIYELSDGPTTDYTEEGKLVGHLVKGLEIVDKYAYRIKNFPYDLKMHLKHILLSHHGEYEYGSPKIPQTSEAMLVHLIDLMDSKMHSFETAKALDNTSGHWTGFVKHLDRIIYKDALPFYPHLPEEARSEEKPEIKQNLGKLLQGLKDS